MKCLLGKCKGFIFNDTIATGFAIFSMFFGAGNVVFPLALGRYAGDKNLYAVLGFLLTAVGVPFLGLLSMVLFNGDYKKFFTRLGRVPGMFVISLLMALIGPLGAIPRCVALSYSTIKSFLPGTTLFMFSIIACIILYLFAFCKSRVIDILGRILSPVLLIFLSIIIIVGFFSPHSAEHIVGSRLTFFGDGLISGYNTMDILAAFFFSTIVIVGLRQRCKNITEKTLVCKTLSAGSLGIALLGVIYLGFSYVSSFYGAHLGAVSDDALISAVSFFSLGPLAGIFACVAVSLACLTTAIALSVVFTDFVRTELLRDKIGYRSTLLMSVVATLAMSNIGFSGIVKLIVPILTVCYPALIVLAVVNIMYKLWDVQTVKVPVFTTFAIALLYRLLQAWW